MFDLFHTLVDTEHLRPPGFDYRRSLVDLLALDRQHFLHWWEERFVERTTTVVDQLDLIDRYLMSCGRPPMDADQRRAVDGFFGVTKDDALRHPRAEMVELVAEVAARVPVGVLSNCHERETRYWPESPLAPLVATFVRSCDIGVRKPDPEAYQAVLEGVGANATASLYIGNGAGEELLGARAVEFAAVIHMNGFDRGNGLVTAREQRRRAGQADRSVGSIDDLRAVLSARLAG